MVMTYQQAREFSLGWKYPVKCSAVKFKNCEYIHPLKQIEVQLIVNMLSKHECVKKIIVFGSAVSMRCHSGSDLDIYVESGTGDARSLMDMSLLRTELDVLDDPLNFSYGVGLAIAREGITVFERE